MKAIPYSCQTIDKQDIKAVTRVLRADYLTQGPAVKYFEEALAKYAGAKYALVFNSGTAALHSAYFAVGLKPGDEFITTPLTFAATANAGLYLGAKPVFVDVDSKTGNIDIDLIEKKITKRTKLIVPVHYSGQPVNLEKLKKVANKHKLQIIDDACHALGAEYKNKKIGGSNYADVTIFSFHPVKHITTGEGGALLTNNKKNYEQALKFRSHGITKNKSFIVNKKAGNWYYEMQELGFNYRMPDILAALGNSQLKKVDTFINRRRQIAKIYDKKFANNPYFETIPEQKHNKHTYHLYPILLKKRFLKHKKEIFNNLKKRGLGVQVHYIPTYLHPYYASLGYKKGLCPESENFYNREISIPIHQAMTATNVDYVVKNLLEIFSEIPLKIGAIIQCRANSNRLPRKIFRKLPFGGNKTVLEQVILRTKASSLINSVIVATTKNQRDDLVVKIAKKTKINYFRGSESNVLKRYYLAAKENNLDIVIRITADCPCLDIEVLNNLIKTHLNQGNDITTNTLVRSFPRGLDVEIIQFSALEKAYCNATTDWQKEHVTQYFYAEEKNNFKVQSIEATGVLRAPEVRITLDNPEDYAFLCAIYENLYPKNKQFSIRDVLDLIKRKPWLKMINEKIALEELNLTNDQKKEIKRLTKNNL